MSAVVHVPWAGAESPASRRGRDLVADVQRGNENAFAPLYARFHPRLVRYFHGRVGDPAVAEDLAQEAMLRLYRNIDGLHADRPVWPWLRTVARNLAIDHHRATRDDADPMGDLGSDEQPGPSVSGGFDRLGDCSEVEYALAELPDRHAAALQMRYLEDLANDQVALFFDITPNACKQLMWRARANLREAYDGQLRGLVVGLLTPWHRLRDRAAALRRGLGDPTLGMVSIPAEHLAASVVASIAGTVLLVSGAVVGAVVVDEPRVTIAPASTSPSAVVARTDADVSVLRHAGGSSGVDQTGREGGPLPAVAGPEGSSPSATTTGQDGQVGAEHATTDVAVDIDDRDDTRRTMSARDEAHAAGPVGPPVDSEGETTVDVPCDDSMLGGVACDVIDVVEDDANDAPGDGPDSSTSSPAGPGTAATAEPITPPGDVAHPGG